MHSSLPGGRLHLTTPVATAAASLAVGTSASRVAVAVVWSGTIGAVAEAALPGASDARRRREARPGERALLAARRRISEAVAELFPPPLVAGPCAAWLVVHDAAAAEDVAQEAFLAAVRALHRFDRGRPFGPWLHRIVVNRAIDYARAREGPRGRRRGGGRTHRAGAGARGPVVSGRLPDRLPARRRAGGGRGRRYGCAAARAARPVNRSRLASRTGPRPGLGRGRRPRAGRGHRHRPRHLAVAEIGRVRARAAVVGRRPAVLARWRADVLRVLEVGGSRVWRTRVPAGRRVVAAAWAPAGGRLALVTRDPRRGLSEVTIARDARRPLAGRRVFATTGRLGGVRWSPGGRRLLVSWRQADQWLFVPADGRGRLVAVGDLRRRFGGAASVAGWCCLRTRS